MKNKQYIQKQAKGLHFRQKNKKQNNLYSVFK